MSGFIKDKPRDCQYCYYWSRKIRTVKQAKGLSGKPVTSRAVYGYCLNDDGKFIIDEEAAPVVRQIYAMCIAD